MVDPIWKLRRPRNNAGVVFVRKSPFVVQKVPETEMVG